MALIKLIIPLGLHQLEIHCIAFLETSPILRTWWLLNRHQKKQVVSMWNNLPIDVKGSQTFFCKFLFLSFIILQKKMGQNIHIKQKSHFTVASSLLSSNCIFCQHIIQSQKMANLEKGNLQHLHIYYSLLMLTKTCPPSRTSSQEV